MNIENIVNTQSKSCSDVCRRIVFAFGALSWGFLNNTSERVNTDQLFPFIALLFVVIYCSIDIIQYLQAYIKANRMMKIQDDIDFNGNLTDEQQACLICKTKMINDKQVECSHRLFIAKVYIIPFIVIANIIHIILSICQTGA